MSEPQEIGAHVLVCRGPDCMSRGAQDVYTEMAVALHSAGLEAAVTQSQSGCIGPLCGQGPVVCCYPTGTWYAGVRPEDCAELVGGDVVGGEPVGRLAAARVTGRPGGGVS